MAPDWAAVRSGFPALEHWTYLNTATFGQLAKRTVDRVAQHFAHRDAEACADFLGWFDDADRIRESIASLIHCKSSDIAFTVNASTSLGLLMGGIDWRAGDRVVSLEDEFPNNIYFPATLGAQGVEFVSPPWERFYESLTPSTRLVLMSTVNYSHGFRPPIEEVSEALRRRGILFYVDGTQSAGTLRFDVNEVQPSMYAVDGYKWLLSPNGAGFMYVAPEIREWLRPNVVGWRSDRRWREVDALHHGPPEFKQAAEKYEGGMLSFPSVYGMGESVQMFLELGPERIEQRVLDLARQCRCVLERAGGEIAHSDSPILAAKFGGVDAGELARKLRARRVLTSARHGRLRVSVHFYNDERDLAALAEALAACR